MGSPEEPEGSLMRPKGRCGQAALGHGFSLIFHGIVLGTHMLSEVCLSSKEELSSKTSHFALFLLSFDLAFMQQ